MKRIILLLALFFSGAALAQNSKIDSLKAVLKNRSVDTVTFNALFRLYWEYRGLDEIDSAKKYAEESLTLSIRLNDRKKQVSSYTLLAKCAYLKHNYPQAIVLYLKAIKIAEEIGDKPLIASCNMRLAGIYFQEGNVEKSYEFDQHALALYKELGDKRNMSELYLHLAGIYDHKKKYGLSESSFMEAQRLAEEVNDPRNLGVLYEQIGYFYVSRKQYDKALKYHQLSLEMSRKNEDEKGVADSYSDIGDIYLAQGKYKEALESNLSALAVYLKSADASTIANSYMIIGQIYLDMDQPVKALEYHLQALQEAAKLPKESNRVATIYLSISDVYIHTKEYDKATMYLQKIIDIAQQSGNEEILKEGYQRMAQMAMENLDYKKAYDYQVLYTAVLDSVYAAREQEFQQVQQLQEQFEAQKKESETQLHLAQIAQQESELKQASTVRFALIAGLLLILVFAGFIYNRFKLTQRQKETISQQKDLVDQQRKQAEQQKHVIEEKQKEIIESISYAKRLQEAILPPREFVNRQVPDNFILYKPKDIIAGDFYWAECVNGLFYIAAADSTGHGVPGALVSVVCSNALNRAVKEFSEKETGRILDKARELVLETFEKSESDVKDGMDISLLCIDKAGKRVYWSGANNPLWYIANNECVQLKPDKQPIGKTDHPRPFTTHVIEYKEGTVFYLFTDGFADQFGMSANAWEQLGGPSSAAALSASGKKFKYKPFEALLFKNHTLDPQIQAIRLNEELEAWKGPLEQVDDVCIICIRL